MLEKYRSDNPANKIKMSLGFAFSKPSHVIASFFGSGVIRPAPGTWGTLAGWIVYVVLAPFISLQSWLAIIAVTFVVGAWACEQTSRDLGVPDHGSIVIDEVFAIWMVLALVPSALLWQIGAFLAFRFFDIVKCPPASYFDQKMKNGIGIMIDDAVAAFYALLLLWGLEYLWAMMG